MEVKNTNNVRYDYALSTATVAKRAAFMRLPSYNPYDLLYNKYNARIYTDHSENDFEYRVELVDPEGTTAYVHLYSLREDRYLDWRIEDNIGVTPFYDGTDLHGITIGRFTNIRVTDTDIRDELNVIFSSDYRPTQEQVTKALKQVENNWHDLGAFAKADPENIEYYISASMFLDKPEELNIYFCAIVNAIGQNLDGSVEIEDAFTKEEKLGFATVALEIMHLYTENAFARVYDALNDWND